MKKSQGLQSFLVFLVAFLSKIPFLFAGFGREEDAWSQALNARNIAESGIYEVSRLPGHPVYELLLAFLWPLNHTYWFFNGLTALATALSVFVFYKILLRHNIKGAFWLSLSFGFVPVFFNAGTYTIDYNFALLFILLSWYQLESGRVFLAALFIGIATGFRISSIAFLLPLSIAVRMNDLKTLLKYWLFAILVALICFLPPIISYGTEFFDFHKPPFPGWASIIYKLTIGVWGIPMILLFILLKSKWLRGQKIKNFIKPGTVGRHLTMAAVISWVLCLVVFARLPFKAEFFIPSIPFLMILVGYLASERQIKLILITSALGSFIMGFDYHNPYRGADPSALAIKFNAGSKLLFFDPIQGPVLIEHSKRKNKSNLADQTLEWARSQKDSSLLISGWYWPELELKKTSNLKVHFDYYSTSSEILEYHKNELPVYYLPEINESNQLINAHYLADSIGKLLDPL